MSIDNLELLKPNVKDPIAIKFVNDYENKLHRLEHARDLIQIKLDNKEIDYHSIKDKFERLNSSIDELNKIINNFKKEYSL